MKFLDFKYSCILLCVFGFLNPLWVLAESTTFELTLESALIQAKTVDPWLEGNRQQQLAMESESVAAGTLPDPKMSLGYANLPTDTFDFDQEGMTQFKVGISQMFPRGDTREIQREKLALLSQQFPYQRQNRLARIDVVVAQLWFDAYRAQESIRLIEEKRELFEQLVDVAEAQYSSAIGRTRQQDVVRAQLELTRLDDRLTVLYQQRAVAEKQLLEWIGTAFIASDAPSVISMTEAQQFSVSSVLPNLSLTKPFLVLSPKSFTHQDLADFLIHHPAIKALDQQIKATGSDVALAEQKYKPEWGINASYGYREDDPMGMDRPDLFSMGVTFDLPIFTGNRQDKQVAAASARAEAKKTEKWLLLRNMIAGFESAKVRLVQLNERQALYQAQLLPQMNEQAEASLTAYTNDDGDFAEVVRARIAELNAQIDALGIDVDRQKTISEINYFFVMAANDRVDEEQE